MVMQLRLTRMVRSRQPSLGPVLARCLALILLSFALLPGKLVAAADDTEGSVVKLSEVPVAVQAAIKTHLGHGRLNEIVKTINGGEAEYDVELTRQGRTRSLVVNESGAVVEMQVFLVETPRPVQQAIRQHVAGGNIEEITKNFDDGDLSYDVEMTKDGKARTFTIDESGKLTEMQVFLDELPEVVRKAIQTETAAGKCGEITKADDDGQVAYQTDITKDGKTRALTFDSKGVLVSQEEPISLSDAPEPVRKLIEERSASAKVLSVSKVVDNGQVSFSVEVLKSGKRQPLNISEDGKVLADSD